MSGSKVRYWCHSCGRIFEAIPNPDDDTECPECHSTSTEIRDGGQEQPNIQQVNHTNQPEPLAESSDDDSDEFEYDEPRTEHNLAQPRRGGVRVIVDVQEHTTYHFINVRRPQPEAEAEDPAIERAIQESLEAQAYSFTSYC